MSLFSIEFLFPFFFFLQSYACPFWAMSLNNDIWFNGPVKDAVALVSQKNCVFLVYIYG